MFAPHALENQIIDAIASEIGLSGVSVAYQGSWLPVVELPETDAAITVAVSTPASPTYSAPQLTFDGSIAIGVRMEQDRDGATFLALAGKVSGILTRWQGETYQRCFTALDIDDGTTHLSVDEISIDQATPTVERDGTYHTIAFPFTLQATTHTSQGY